MLGPKATSLVSTSYARLVIKTVLAFTIFFPEIWLFLESNVRQFISVEKKNNLQQKNSKKHLKTDVSIF